MQSSTGRWVSGENFFNRDRELRILEERIRARNHILLTGQRRMGKTSVARELGRRLEIEGWVFLFTDVEGATCAEDAIACIAEAVYPIRPIMSRFIARMGRLTAGMGRWFKNNIQEVGAYQFRVGIRAGLNAGNWQRHGEELLRACAVQGKPVLLVIDELPIFLKRMLHDEDGFKRVDEFLSWLRSVLQDLGDDSPVLIVSGSIGLAPLVKQLKIPDRINHLYPFRLGPWGRDTSVLCFDQLAASCGLQVEEGVGTAVYDALGMGIPHHVQSFFARLQDHAIMQGRNRVTVEDVDEVYRTELLGPSGQNDLVHYETRLKEALGDERSYSLAMVILAEAATQNVFTSDAQHCLEQLYSQMVDDAPGLIVDILDILMHDGYLTAGKDGYCFPSHLLKDWWASRFRGHHKALENRPFAQPMGFR
ncbi:MAG: ATP-binding protein [Bacteroidetes bacterium SB0662_bin_6]|nr:ATP-binding protein [Bacteroidetes bacterium SB0668_bin_1]MYE04092.1 ATP-binding protein [Bacteroidetes bacterium SB0662_bin_6]